MAAPIPPVTPKFSLAEGFTLPPLDAEAMRIANEVFATQHYTSAPLIDAATRERALGHAYPQRLVGGFACRGFVIHTLQQEEDSTMADAFTAPPPEMNEVAFLKLCLQLSEFDMPEPGFEDRAPALRDVAAALGRTGIPAAAGVHIGVNMYNPATSFASLVVPRVYIDEFGSQHADQQSGESPSQYGVKTAAHLFLYLTIKQLEAHGEPVLKE